MAKNFVTKKTAVKNITGRAPAINYLSEKLTALGIIALLLLFVYWFRSNSETPSNLIETYNEQLVSGDFYGASETISKAKEEGINPTFLSEGEEQRLKEVNEIINQYPE